MFYCNLQIIQCLPLFLPDLEYRQQLLSSLDRGVLEAAKLKKFVGGRGSTYDAPPDLVGWGRG